MVTVVGEPGELTLFAFGRQGVADVELDGDKEAIAQVMEAKLGV